MTKHTPESNYVVLNSTYFEINCTISVSHTEKIIRLLVIDTQSEKSEYSYQDLNKTIIHSDIMPIYLQQNDHNNFQHFKHILPYYIFYLSELYPSYSFITVSTGGGNTLSQLLSIYFYKTYYIQTSYLYLFDITHTLPNKDYLVRYIIQSIKYGYHLLTSPSTQKIDYLTNICLYCD